MPSVTAPAKVLVTGSTGFLAVWIVKSLIDQGFYVRGAVRKVSKGEFLKQKFGDKFEYVIVADQTKRDAYDMAVVGVNAVVHTASPVEFPAGDPELIIKPAVEGTVNILESARMFGTKVKRIVITSSTVAVADTSENVVVDETSWNDAVVTMTREQGADAHPGVKYSASKVLAERAAWDFVEKYTGALSYDLVTLTPPWIFGPAITEGSDPSSLNISMNYLLAALDPKHPKTGEELTKKDGEYVDVRDVANIHALVLQAEAAGNQRLLPDAGAYSWQSVYDALHAAPAAKDVPRGKPGSAKAYVSANTQKISRVLGKSPKELYRPLAETVKDSLESARLRGWVPPSAVKAKRNSSLLAKIRHALHV